MIKLNENTLYISTRTLDAEIENGCLTRLCDKAGNVFISADAEKCGGLKIIFRSGEASLKDSVVKQLHTVLLSDTCAEIRFDCWEGNGLITVSEDAETGELIIEPEVTSARRGVFAARYFFNGISDSLRVCVPLYQGVDMERRDPLLAGRYEWPFIWEASMLILHDPIEKRGFWVHSEDSDYRYKALSLGVGDDAGFALDSEAYGPLENSFSAGGISWRINVFEGSFRTPALTYKSWLYKTYGLEKQRAACADWLGDLRLALSWCPTNADLLDELAKKVDPKKVLLHLPNWRANRYDTCYPDFTPSNSFKAFYKYATEKGFHCAPHANSIDMDPSMPEYAYLSDFKCREVLTGSFYGWGWDNGKGLPVPTSNHALSCNRDKNVMVKIHPGLALWRSMLAERIKEGLDQLDGFRDSVFIDVTLCSYNLENCLVDNTTSTEGMKRLIEHVGRIPGSDGRSVAVGGEGLNEITMQGLSFAQAHTFKFLNSSELERCGNCDLNNLMFGELCRTIGYSALSGANETEVLRERIYEEHGAIPTMTVGSAEQIANPNAEIKRLLELANS